MKKIKNYGSIIKDLLDVTDTKFTVLAKAVGYDISYISKWCNNIKIPSMRNIETVNKKLSLFFSEEIIKQNKINEISHILDVKSYLGTSPDKDKLSDCIFKLLENGYKTSRSELLQKSDTSNENVKVIFGNKQVAVYIMDLIKTTIENSKTDIELICTLDICKISSLTNLDIFNDFMLDNIKVNGKIALNMEEFEENSDHYIPRIYFILSECLNVDFDIYDSKKLDKLNIIAVKDKFAILCSLNNSGLIDVATVVTDNELVNNIYDQTNMKFKTENLLIKSTEYLGMDQGGYRTEFYSDEEFQFLSTRGFEFLLPGNIITEIIKDAYEQGYGDDISFLIKKIQITWEEIFEKSKISFIILKSALMKYIEDGEIFYAEVSYNLTPEQRKNHALNILDCMRNNSDIKITVLDDELLNYRSVFNMSVFVNNKKIFLKKNRKTKENISLYYTINNEKLVKYISDYLLSIKNKEFCMEYDVNALEKVVEKYGTMFLRILDAQKISMKI